MTNGRRPHEMDFRSLPGLVPYEEARRIQLDLVEKRARDEIPDTVLILEHEPVITRGRGLQFDPNRGARQMPFAPDSLPKGIAFAESERGGDLTYHGPGQLVVYPICKLDGKGFGPERDVTGFLRKLEQVFIDVLASWDIRASAKPGATGIWVETAAQGERKVASLGIAVRKWVTYHGIAINCVNDLFPFQFISPCGFAPEVMTRVEDLLPSGMGPGWRSEMESRVREGILG